MTDLSGGGDIDPLRERRDIRLVDICRDIYSARLSVLIGMFLGLFASLLFIFLANPHFQGTLKIKPASPMNGSEISSLLANDNLFALRYLVQRVGMSNSSDYAQFENIYYGPTIAAKLLQDDIVKKGLRQDLAYKFSKPKSGWGPMKFSDYLSRRVSLSSIGTTGVQALMYSHPDPDFVVYLLNEIHSYADTMIRNKIRTEASERVAYLSQSIDATNNPEHRRTLTTLLMEQERLLMLVSIDQPYAASIVEPASASYKAVWPNRALLFAVFIFTGAFFGFLIYSIRYGSR